MNGEFGVYHQPHLERPTNQPLDTNTDTHTHTDPYLIVLSVDCVVAATGALLHTLAGAQHEAGVAHAALGAGAPTARGPPTAGLLAGGRTRLVVAVGITWESWGERERETEGAREGDYITI